MDEDKKLLWKIGGLILAVLIAGSWIWSWIFPQDPNKYNVPNPVKSESPASNPNDTSSNYYPDLCEDAPTVEDYKSCLEDEALKDYQQEREGEAGLP